MCARNLAVQLLRAKSKFYLLMRGNRSEKRLSSFVCVYYRTGAVHTHTRGGKGSCAEGHELHTYTALQHTERFSGRQLHISVHTTVELSSTGRRHRRRRRRRGSHYGKSLRRRRQCCGPTSIGPQTYRQATRSSQSPCARRVPALAYWRQGQNGTPNPLAPLLSDEDLHHKLVAR